MIPRLLITPGEPAGIGPDILIRSVQTSWPQELVAIADPDLLTQRAKQINLPLKLIECDLNVAPEVQKAGTLKIIPIPLQTLAEPGQLNPLNANYVIQTLTKAANLCMEKKAQGIVTGPVHKGVINKAGIPFTGHTEFFAEKSHVAQTVMLFVVDQLRVALATTHLPLAKVASAITKEKLRTTLSILHEGIKKYFGITMPRILICGLNPHAGENGYLGREEIEIIEPVLAEMRSLDYQLEGPLPADTLFAPKFLECAAHLTENAKEK